MKRWYVFRFVRVFSRKYPILFFAILAGFGYLAYLYAMRFSWAREILNFVSTMISVEYGAARMYREGKPLATIVGSMALAHTCNIIIDLILVRQILKSTWALRVLTAFSLRGKAFMRDIRNIFKRKRTENDDANPSALEKFRDHINGYKKNPTKAGLWTVFGLCLLPRIPPLPGGVSIAILIITYNKMALRGWLVLTAGICVHASYVLGSIYGLSSLYSMLFS